MHYINIRSGAEHVFHPMCLPSKCADELEIQLWLSDVPLDLIKDKYASLLLSDPDFTVFGRLNSLNNLFVEAVKAIAVEPMCEENNNFVALIWPKAFRRNYEMLSAITNVIDDLPPVPLPASDATNKSTQGMIDERNERNNLLEKRCNFLKQRVNEAVKSGGSKLEADMCIALMVRDGFKPEYCCCCFMSGVKFSQSHIVSDAYLKLLGIGLTIFKFNCKASRVIENSKSMKVYLQCISCDNTQGTKLERIIDDIKGQMQIIIGKLKCYSEDYIELPSQFVKYLIPNVFRMLMVNCYDGSAPVFHWTVLCELRSKMTKKMFSTEVDTSVSFWSYLFPISNKVKTRVDELNQELKGDAKRYEGNFGVFHDARRDDVLYIFFAPFVLVITKKEDPEAAAYAVDFNAEVDTTYSLPVASCCLVLAAFAAASNCKPIESEINELKNEKDKEKSTKKLAVLRNSSDKEDQAHNLMSLIQCALRRGIQFDEFHCLGFVVNRKGFSDLMKANKYFIDEDVSKVVAPEYVDKIIDGLALFIEEGKQAELEEATADVKNLVEKIKASVAFEKEN